MNRIKRIMPKALAAVMISKKKTKKEAAQPESDAQPKKADSTKN